MSNRPPACRDTARLPILLRPIDLSLMPAFTTPCRSLIPRLGLGLLVALLAGPVLATETARPTSDRLGTLFYSAAERSAITRARQGDADTEAQTSTLINLSGFVRRERGKGTVWLNGQPVPEGQSFSPNASSQLSSHGVTVNGQRVRVGQTLDTTTGEISDILAPGDMTQKGQK